MTKQIQLFLVPQPGANPEFLATLAPTNDASDAILELWNDPSLPTKVILEGYTRDGWAWKPNSLALTSVRVQSTDQRGHKLDGFVKYLADRQKSAYGRFAIPSSNHRTGICIVSYIQKKESNRMDCRISLDLTQIPNCTLSVLVKKNTTKPQSSTNTAVTKPPVAVNSRPRKAGGLLGKLVGAQQRTNQHVQVAIQKPVTSGGRTSASTNNNDTSTANIPTLRTSQQVLSEFRNEMEQKMLNFDISPEETMTLSVTLAEHTTGLSIEDKAKVTMEILKYMVYEAAEEVNDEWIAYKEPSEFMDEATFTIYKEGAAPPEVLEEINKGELPEEMRAEQRAIATERQRQVQQAESRNQRQVMQQAHNEYDDDMEVLNQNKRDRRTIEDYQREKNKRSKS